jgi:uncharacterized protein YbjT (DUF2867 family)
MPMSAAEFGPAFVAGATGYTGRAVVHRLVELKVPTHAHVRPDSRQLARWRDEFATLGAAVDTTPWDESALRKTFVQHRPAVIFALLGTTRARVHEAVGRGVAKSAVDYQSVDYGLTMMLLHAAVAAEIRPRFVYLSAIGVTETARSPYYRARWQAETEIRQSGLPYVIARPSFITGADREPARPLEHAAAKTIDGALTFAGWVGFGRLRDRYQSLSGDDLARALVRLALEADAANQVYETDELRRL